MLTVPFVLLALSHGKAEGAIWLMFPVILFIPVLVGSIFLFAPFEALVVRLGLDPNIFLPLFGGVIGAAIVAIAMKFSRNPEVVAKLLRGDFPTLAATLGIILAGVLVGGIWRASSWALKLLREA